MTGAGGRLNLPDPRCEMMVCYLGAESQSLPVLKKVPLGDSALKRSRSIPLSRYKLVEAS